MSRRLFAIFLAVLVAFAASCSSSGEDPTTTSEDESTAADTSSEETSTTEAAASTDAGDDDADGGKPDVVVPEGPAPTELVIDDLIVGDGRTATAGDFLVMEYVGVRHSDGGQFDASWDRGEPFSFTLGTGMVIQGWDQGIDGMQEGGRRLLSIPSGLAYGDQAVGADIPAGSALVFVVDLLTVVSPPDVQNAPAPVTELEVTVLEEGDGAVVEPGDVIEVHYVAMLQTTGEVFDSSWAGGRPVPVTIGSDPPQVLEAWDEGLLGRRVGDLVRLVIPPEMGIDDPSGAIPADATIITEVNIISAR